jgi:hypothetical protein
MKQYLFIIFLFASVWVKSAAATEYGVVLTPAPVLNTPDFKAVFGGASGQRLKTDGCGQVRELEYIALPGTVVAILKKQRAAQLDIYEVKTEEYTPAGNIHLFVESRFIRLVKSLPEQRRKKLPQRDEIVAALRSSVGSPYVWGGNVLPGVPELAKWFYKNIREADERRLELAGLDCSGLLYHATGGWTPRNTSQLITFGQSVDIAGKQSAEIAAMLQPLDLIVWNGHVIIVLDQKSVIESRLKCGQPGNGGVVVTPLRERITGIMHTRHPVDAWTGGKKRQDIFVVRRWYNQ